MPVLWFEQHVVASKTISNLVKLILAVPLIGQVLGALLLLFGIVLVLSVCCCNNDQYEIPLTENSKTENQKTTNLPETLPLMKN